MSRSLDWYGQAWRATTGPGEPCCAGRDPLCGDGRTTRARLCAGPRPVAIDAQRPTLPRVPF